MSDRDSLADMLGGGAEVAGVEAHAALARLRRGMFAKTEATVHLGRYRDLEEIGRGGMSVVYRGHDPKVDRSVAIKVLRNDGPDQEQRLRREAQAMARLSHPNVVQVLEVGRHHDETYVVMELVEGCDAAAWLTEQERSWREILDVFLAAGEGLRVAHAEGLVHRDFKPSNVLVGSDGRVCVTDFGLVASVGSLPRDARAITGRTDADDDLDGLQTATGTRLGTPRYMAPEQRRATQVDHRADQWSFAASLWESIYGGHPLADSEGRLDPGRTEPRRPASRGGSPSSILRILTRALAFDPADRHPSMDALLERLRAAPRARRSRTVVLGGLAVTAVLGGGLWWGTGTPPSPSPCDPAEFSASLWNEERRATIETAFEATHQPFAAQTSAVVGRRVSRWVDSWNEDYRQACEAGVPESNPHAQLRRSCLRAELTEVDGLLEALGRADRALVVRAEAATRTLPDHAHCVDSARANEIDPSVLAAHAEQMAEIQALVRVGRYRDAAALAHEARERSREPSLHAELSLSWGLNLRRSGDLEQARAPMEEAFDVAAAAGDAPLANKAAQGLLHLAIARSDVQGAETWVRHFQTWIARLDDPAARRTETRELGLASAELKYRQGRYDDALADLHAVWDSLEHDETADRVPRMFNLMGMVHLQKGTYDDAARWFERSIELESARSGPEHPQVAASLENLGSVQWYRNDLDSAEDYYRRALEIRTVALGPDNAKTINTVMNLGIVASERGDEQLAVARLEEAVESFTRVVGREHPSTAHALDNLAATLSGQGQWERSNELNREAVEIYEAVLGPEHPSVGHALENLAAGLADVGRYEQALQMHERALGIIETTQGREHLRYGHGLHNMAVVLRRLGRYDDAESRDREALAIYERVHGPEHPEVAIVLVGLADNAVASERWDDALALATRARSIGAADAFVRGLAAFFVAQANWEAKSRAGVPAFVEEARREFAEAGRNGAENLAALEAWAVERGLDEAKSALARPVGGR